MRKVWTQIADWTIERKNRIKLIWNDADTQKNGLLKRGRRGRPDLGRPAAGAEIRGRAGALPGPGRGRDGLGRRHVGAGRCPEHGADLRLHRLSPTSRNLRASPSTATATTRRCWAPTSIRATPTRRTLPRPIRAKAWPTSTRGRPRRPGTPRCAPSSSTSSRAPDPRLAEPRPRHGAGVISMTDKCAASGDGAKRARQRGDSG